MVALEERIPVEGAAMQALGLSHPGHSGFYALAECRIGDDGGEALAVGGHIGAGPYEAHCAEKYIKKLW